MRWKSRSCVFLVIGAFVFVLVKVFVKTKYGQQSVAISGERTDRELSSRTWARNTVENNEESNQDNSDYVITGLKQELMKLRLELYKLKKSCRGSPTVKRENITKIYKKLYDKKDTKGSRRKQQIIQIIPRLLPKKAAPSVFRSFTTTTLYGVNIQTPPGVWFNGKSLGQTGEYRHLNIALKRAMVILQKSLRLPRTINITLIRGLYHEDTNLGVEYEFQCSLADSQALYNVRLMRPYSALTLTQKPARVFNGNELVNIIVPLAGRTDRFKQFLEHFIEVCVAQNENVFLTIVYNGEENVTEAKRLLWQLAKQHEFHDFYFVHRNREFSRGHALHDGVLRWRKTKNVLMFFCDVDIKFESGFLDRCRSYTERGRKVYYPIVFSLYNPEYVRKMTSRLMAIRKKTGFWRYYGYGMTCQYRNDYFKVGGFNLQIKGWGSEDVTLYQKYVRLRHVRVIRAPDSGLFHYYHPKKCDTSLPWQQRRSCMSTKIDNEASKKQFARRVYELERDKQILT